MKSLVFILALLAITACDPYGFGFKRNPAFVLDEAFKAVGNLDTQSLMDVSDKEFFCNYANNEGINFLKENLNLRHESLKFVPKVLDSEFYKIPRYVGFWSYYHERYQIDILDKTSNENIVKAIIDCNYGTENRKDEKYVDMKIKKHKKKECKIVKLVSKIFKARDLDKRCKQLQVIL